MQNTGLPQLALMLSDLWEFEKKFYEPQGNEAYWDDLVKATGELGAKYNSKYLNALIIVCIDDIESRYSKSSYDHKIDTLDKTYERLRRKHEKL